MLFSLFRATSVFEGMELPDLSGKFASFRDGTWHETHYKTHDILSPTFILYTCSNPNACELEIMAHSEGVLPEKLYSQEITGFNESDIEILEPSALPKDWKFRPEITQKIGME